MDLLLLGKEKISEAAPTGVDVRYDQEFEQLQGEIDKLSSPSASGTLDWARVDSLATRILAEKSKDLLVAGYLAIAQIRLRGVQGFAAGLCIYRDLIEHFWEDLFPSKKRMRGRVAAIEWWLEKSEAAFASIKVPPLPAQQVEQYRQHLVVIDKLLRGYLENAPLLRPLERFVDSIPIQAEAKPTSEVALAEEIKSVTPPAAQPTAPSAPGSAPAQSKPAPAPTGDIASPSDADMVLKSALQSIRRVGDYFNNQKLSDPRGFYCRRIAGWSMIQDLPPAVDGKTQIPLPNEYETVRGNLKSFKGSANWEAMVRMAEEKFSGALLWLDLQRFAAEGLSGLGGSYEKACEAVCRETAYLVHRIAGVETLSFSDGKPFCDAETLQWLKGIGFGGGTSIGEPVTVTEAGKDDAMAQTIQKAQALAKEKKIGEAVTILQQALRGSFSKQEQLLWRLALSQILVTAKKPELALPHLKLVLQDIDTYKLEEWDPGLALKGLKMVWTGFSVRSDEAAKDHAAEVLNRIAMLDPAEALVFAKR